MEVVTIAPCFGMPHQQQMRPSPRRHTRWQDLYGYQQAIGQGVECWMLSSGGMVHTYNNHSGSRGLGLVRSVISKLGWPMAPVFNRLISNALSRFHIVHNVESWVWAVDRGELARGKGSFWCRDWDGSPRPNRIGAAIPCNQPMAAIPSHPAKCAPGQIVVSSARLGVGRGHQHKSREKEEEHQAVPPTDHYTRDWAREREKRVRAIVAWLARGISLFFSKPRSGRRNRARRWLSHNIAVAVLRFVLRQSGTSKYPRPCMNTSFVRPRNRDLLSASLLPALVSV